MDHYPKLRLALSVLSGRVGASQLSEDQLLQLGLLPGQVAGNLELVKIAAEEAILEAITER